VQLVRSLGHWVVAAAVLAVGLLLTWMLTHRQLLANEQMQRERLSQAVSATTDALAQRVRAYADLVAGVRDLFLANPQLTWRQFDRVARGRDFPRDYPELRHLTFTRVVGAAELPAFEQRLRDQAREAGVAVEGRIIHPVLERSEHHIIEYLWSREDEPHLLGLDVGGHPASLQALARARETGEPVVSPPLDPAGARDESRAFTLRYPVFDEATPGADGRPRFIGTVAATVGIGAMLDGLRFGGAIRPVALQWRDDGAVGAAPGPGASQWLGETADLGALWQQRGPQQEATLPILGRRWRLIYVPAQPLLSSAEAMLPRWMAGAGGTLSVLLALGAWLLLAQRARAAALVDEADARHRSSEQRLRAMFEQAAVGVAMIDMRTLRFERVNRKFCDMLGYTSEEMLKLSVSDVSHGRDAAVNDDLRDQLRQGKISAFHMEKCMLRKDGSEVWVDLTVAPVLRDGGLPQHNVGVIQDISERRAMREELQASEQRLRAILDHLPLGIAMWHSGRVVFRNRSFVQLTGYGEGIMMTGEQWWRMAYPNDAVRQRAQTRWKERTLRAKSHGGFVEWDEYEICCADGRMKPVGISGILLKSSQLFILEDLSQHKAAEDEINALAHYDALTGLANRRMLVERFGHALAASAANGQCGAVLMLDLDHFKTLNETRGHERGDALLRLVAARLRACVGQDDLLARHGDDEFVVVLAGTHATLEQARTQARAVGERILGALRAPFRIEGGLHHATISAGAAVFLGQEEAVDELLRQADMAMHQAKAAGRDTLRFYDPRIQTQVQARASLERDLRGALELGQFELRYQAQVRGGRITGAEALVRWRHPGGNTVSPAEFIPLAEETGLIMALGDWVLRSACAQLVLWARQPRLAELSLAVNISPRQFAQSDFVAQVLAAIAGSGANPRRLELEVTEGLLLQDVEDTIAKMIQLKAYGLDFSLDDFGTGYSSLAYLKRLPLDQLKIDQSFVRDVLVDPNDAAIARTVVALGNSLGLRVIAEGVETEAQRVFLKRHGCDAWQGYLLSPPVPAPDFEALVRRGVSFP